MTLKVTDTDGRVQHGDRRDQGQRDAQGGGHGQRDVRHRTARGDVQRARLDRRRRWSAHLRLGPRRGHPARRLHGGPAGLHLHDARHLHRDPQGHGHQGRVQHGDRGDQGQRGAQGGGHGQRDIRHRTARGAFNGLGSTDADGDALTYAWDLDGDNLLDDSTAAQPAFTYTTPGTYTVTLKVTDTKGAPARRRWRSRFRHPPPDPGPGPRTSPFVPIAKPGSYVQGTTLSGLIQGASVSQSAEAGQPARAIITTASAKADGSRPGATFEMAVHLPDGMARNTSSFATCDPTSLETQGPQACPAGSVIGAGSAVFDAWPVVADFVDAQVTIFNGTGGSVLLYVLPGARSGLRHRGSPDGRLRDRVRGSADPHRAGRTARRARGADARPPVVRLPDEPAGAARRPASPGDSTSCTRAASGSHRRSGSVARVVRRLRATTVPQSRRCRRLRPTPPRSTTRRSRSCSRPALRVRTSTSSSCGRR